MPKWVKQLHVYKKQAKVMLVCSPCTNQIICLQKQSICSIIQTIILTFKEHHLTRALIYVETTSSISPGYQSRFNQRDNIPISTVCESPSTLKKIQHMKPLLTHLLPTVWLPSLYLYLPEQTANLTELLYDLVQ